MKNITIIQVIRNTEFVRIPFGFRPFPIFMGRVLGALFTPKEW